MPKHARRQQAGRRQGGARLPRTRPLPLRSTLQLRRPVDIWHKPALSAAVALAVPDAVLLTLGRMDLVLYTSAGAMCALYAHGLPYAARARTLLWVVLGMVASLGAALLSASLVTSPVLLVLLASLLAALHKTVCDATRIGPPGNLIFTFIAASAFFVPQHLGQVPFHLALALGGGAVAWAVGMAPALVRPHGPERIAVARALEAAAALWRAEQQGGLAGRHATATAVHAARRTLALVRPEVRPGSGDERTAPEQAESERAALERLLVHAESALAAPAALAAPGVPVTPAPDPDSEGQRCADLARVLRRGRSLPPAVLTPADDRILALRPGPPPPGRAPGVRQVLARLRPGSPLLPIGARVAVGCALAGWASLAVGVGHPYWAVVTAASLFQANTTLSWQRAVQRLIGNVLGLALFFALLPLIHTGQLTMVALALAFQIGAEALITRNYWLGSVCVTPMALLLTQLGATLPARTLIADRALDTLMGAALGLLCCLLVTNRRATDRIEAALAHVTATEAAARRIVELRAVPDHTTGWARDRLALALVELHEAADVAAGEWWQRALPAGPVATAEQDGHRTLALLVRHTAPSAPAA
ncbi:FUSC family protein [Streptomyces sp. NBC_01089]|uniref:FUSC family protein n=1 Tax=Streptomyces sp. NBC_01089 TaxID=2903747 RepID=UPI0038641D6D|nr:FUSC family protein [Streptomyces sp. NBC_01089]